MFFIKHILEYIFLCSWAIQEVEMNTLQYTFKSRLK